MYETLSWVQRFFSEKLSSFSCVASLQNIHEVIFMVRMLNDYVNRITGTCTGIYNFKHESTDDQT